MLLADLVILADRVDLLISLPIPSWEVDLFPRMVQMLGGVVGAEVVGEVVLLCAIRRWVRLIRRLLALMVGLATVVVVARAEVLAPSTPFSSTNPPRLQLPSAKPFS
jgi:hypothetical protein